MRETKGPRTTSNVWESGHDKPRLTSAWEANLQHISQSSQGEIKPKLNHAREIWDELWNYKTFLRVEWEIFPQRRVTRIFLVTIITHFSKLTLNSSAVEQPFSTDLQRKVLVSITSIYLQRLCPTTSMLTHHILQVEESNLSLFHAEYNEEVHMLLRNRKFSQLIIFSRQLNCQRAVTYPSLFSDMPIRRAAHCWTDAIFHTLNPKIKIWILICCP